KIQLALGIAEGLKYLHGCDSLRSNRYPKILPAPIPKIGDFGAEKHIGLTTSHRNGVMGAICYHKPQRNIKRDYPLHKR
ncbi:15095_t:CDS:2, partial [Gigaspora rosea]